MHLIPTRGLQNLILIKKSFAMCVHGSKAERLHVFCTALGPITQKARKWRVVHDFSELELVMIHQAA